MQFGTQFGEHIVELLQFLCSRHDMESREVSDWEIAQIVLCRNAHSLEEHNQLLETIERRAPADEKEDRSWSPAWIHSYPFSQQSSVLCALSTSIADPPGAIKQGQGSTQWPSFAYTTVPSFYGTVPIIRWTVLIKRGTSSPEIAFQ